MKKPPVKSGFSDSERSWVVRPADFEPWKRLGDIVFVSEERPVDDSTPEGFDSMCILRSKSVDRALKGHDMSRKVFREILLGMMKDGLFYWVIPYDEVEIP